MEADKKALIKKRDNRIDWISLISGLIIAYIVYEFTIFGIFTSIFTLFISAWMVKQIISAILKTEKKDTEIDNN